MTAKLLSTAIQNERINIQDNARRIDEMTDGNRADEITFTDMAFFNA